MRKVISILLMLLAPMCLAQSSLLDVKARLESNALFLRGFWGDKVLVFDSTGQLQGQSKIVPFTLSGFEIRKVSLQNGRLILEGRRLGVAYSDGKWQKVALDAGELRDRRDQPLRVEIISSPSGNFDPALDAIFAPDIGHLASSVPVEWQEFMRKQYPSVVGADAAAPGANTAASASGDDSAKPVRKIGGAVTPPRVTRQVNPEFNQEVRHLAYSGAVTVGLVVQTDGTPTNVRIIKPTGLGLDEQALAAVKKYRFVPAKENGNPVPVELNIQVNFQIDP